MNVIHISEALPSLSLDQLWHEAEQLGAVKADPSWNKTFYEVTITFTRSSGTRIWAVGKDSNIAFALAKAINEAREMGAGVPQ